MSEHAIMVLLGIASVAVTISGFSGVVAVFGGRALGHWLPHERFRMMNMLILSLGVCLFCFVPLTEELFHVSEQFLWQSSSLFLGVFCAYYFVYAKVKIQKSHLRGPGRLIEWVRIVFFTCLALAIALQTLNAAGNVIVRGPGPFIAGLIFLLIPAALQFALLVLEPLGSAAKE